MKMKKKMSLGLSVVCVAIVSCFWGAGVGYGAVVVVDDFNDSTVGSIWTTTGTVSEDTAPPGELRLYGASSATLNATAGIALPQPRQTLTIETTQLGNGIEVSRTSTYGTGQIRDAQTYPTDRYGNMR